jgi:Arsenical resistance operon protein ArsD
MPKIEVFDPAMCCSTGVCGPKVDSSLARFASDLEALKRAGATVIRYNLSQQPGAFVDNETVATAMRDKGECLPLILVDGRIVAEKSYPTRATLASLAGVALVEA